MMFDRPTNSSPDWGRRSTASSATCEPIVSRSQRSHAAKNVRAASTPARSSMTHLLAAECAGDHEVLDLVCALADLENLGVAVEACDRRLEHVAETAVDLYRLRRRPRRDAAGLHLRHRGFLHERL